MANLGFTLDKDFGIFLATLVEESIIIKYDVGNAIQILKDTLGTSYEQAMMLIIGKYVLKSNEDQTVSFIERTEEHEQYPLGYIRLYKWYLRIIEEIENDIESVYEVIKEAKRSRYSGIIELNLDIENLIDLYINNDIDVIIDILEDEYNPYLVAIKFIKNIVNKIESLNSVIKSFKEYKDFDFTELVLFDNSVINKILSFIRDTEKISIDIDKYLKTQRELDKKFENSLESQDITDGYSAGWLSPEGVFYGANGTVANMLHINIADYLQEKEVIPKDIEQSADSYLEREGWVRISGDWILYGGYYFGKKITKEQIEELIKYGNFCCKGALKVGCEMQYIPATRLDLLDEFGIKKLFEL